MVSRGLSFLLLLLSSLSVIIAGLGPLEIDKDTPKNIEGGKQALLFSSMVAYDKDTTDESLFKDDMQLAYMAKQAFIEMMKHPDAPPGKNRMPYVMTALAVGKEIFFSSSMKAQGRSFLYDLASIQPDNPMVECLNRCQVSQQNAHPDDAELAAKTHKNMANCGECMAMWQWYHKHPNEKLANQPNRRIVTVRDPSKPKPADFKEENVEVFDPCNEQNGWGCREVTTDDGQRLHVIGEGSGTKKDFKVVDPLPKTASITHVWIECPKQ